SEAGSRQRPAMTPKAHVAKRCRWFRSGKAPRLRPMGHRIGGPSRCQGGVFQLVAGWNTNQYDGTICLLNGRNAT
ncbi:MAG TPA: hypothetical protein VFQ06_10115, partial [Nitrospira sp.]|nr:hypothetical protein [Nitrospira sp.]